MNNINIEIEYYKGDNPKILCKQQLDINKKYKKSEKNNNDYIPYKYITKIINGVVLKNNFINNIYIWFYNNDSIIFKSIKLNTENNQEYFHISYQNKINNYLTNIKYVNLSYNFNIDDKNYKNNNLLIPLIPIINNIYFNKYIDINYNFNNIEIFKNCMSYIFYDDYSKELKKEDKNNIIINNDETKLKKDIKRYIHKKLLKINNNENIINKNDIITINKKIMNIEKIIVYIIIFITIYIILHLK